MVCYSSMDSAVDRREGIRLLIKFVNILTRSRTDLCAGSNAISAVIVGYNFVLGDERHSHATEVKKALCMILYSLGKVSFGFLTKRLGVSRTTTYFWIRHAAASMDEPTIAPDIQEIEFDEMWHVMQSNKEKSGLLKPWIVVQGEPLPGY